MTESIDPSDFHDRVIDGPAGFKTVALGSNDGAELENVEMHPVSKGQLSEAIEAMPSDVFDGVDTDDEDISAEEAEEIAKQQGGSQVTRDMYEAFEELCKNSLEHAGLSNTQIGLIIDEFAFDIVFEIGSEILTYSIENSGNVTDFRVQN